MLILKLKERINFYFEDLTTPMGKTFDLVVIALIFIMCGVFVLETYDLPERMMKVVKRVETVITVIFIIEYLLRFWVAQNKLKHFFHIYSLIDLAAIIPIFFAQQHFQVIRVFRALRIMRLLRFLDNPHFFLRQHQAHSPHYLPYHLHHDFNCICFRRTHFLCGTQDQSGKFFHLL